MQRWQVIASLLGGPRVGAEIGVGRGIMTKNILALLPTIKTYYCVDPWELTKDYDELLKSVGVNEIDYNEIFKTFYRNVKDSLGRVVIYKMVSEAAVDAVEDESLDFVFIDGNHSFEHVENDISLWFRKVKIGGLIAGHDYGEKFPGVRKAVDKLFWAGIETGDDSTWWFWKC